MNDNSSFNVEYLFNKLYNFWNGVKDSFSWLWSGGSSSEPTSSGSGGAGGSSGANGTGGGDGTGFSGGDGSSSDGFFSFLGFGSRSDGGISSGSGSSGGAEYGGGIQGFFGRIFDSSSSFLTSFKGLFELFSVILIVGILYALVRVYEIRKEERRKSGTPPVVITKPPVDRSRWEVVVRHSESENPADWRLAIIEADNMLDEMVKSMGYVGENLGERLRVIEPSDFETLNQAWEAHRVRNRIVHEGSTFELTRMEMDRVITLYQNVFNEFEYI